MPPYYRDDPSIGMKGTTCQRLAKLVEYLATEKMALLQQLGLHFQNVNSEDACYSRDHVYSLVMRSGAEPSDWLTCE